MLGPLFSRQPPPMVGLDISSSSVKLVELGQDRSGAWVLERCAIEPLGSGWISEGNIENFDEVVDACRRLVKRSGTKAKSVAMALPSSLVITKKIMLPSGLSGQELEVQVESEAAQYIPFSLDEVSLDYCIIGPNENSADDVDILIAASRREKVEDRQGLAEAIGLAPAVMDVDSIAARLAAERVIDEMPGGGGTATIALFQIGGEQTAFQVLHQGEVIYERDQPFGGNQLTQLIVRQYGFTMEEAETKKRAGELPEDFRETVLEPYVATLSQEIERAIKFFFTSTPHNRLDYVLLAGGSAGLYGLTEAVTEITTYPCRTINPFDGMEIGRGVHEKRMLREAPSYLTACGLAMRRFLS